MRNFAASGQPAAPSHSPGPRAPLGASWSAAALALTLLAGAASAQFLDVAAGDLHTLALRADGQVVAWGANGSGQCDVPALPAGLTYVEVAAGGGTGLLTSDMPPGFSVARRSDGSVVTWGGIWVQDPPALPPGLTYTGIAAGPSHALALRSDGMVVAWGDNTVGQCDVPALPPGLTYVEISAGGRGEEIVDFCSFSGGAGPGNFAVTEGYSVARRSDGSVVIWGSNSAVSSGVPALPPGLTYVEVSAGADHAAARRSDGSVVAWGANDLGQTDVPAPPPGLGYAGLDAGAGNTTAWLSDGTLVEWGQPLATGAVGLAAPPLPPGTSYVDLDVGGAKGTGQHWFLVDPFGGTCGFSDYSWATAHVVALRSDGTVVAWGDNGSYQAFDPWTDLGGGTSGVDGVPQLTMSGWLTAGSTLGLSLVDGPSSSLVLLVIAENPMPLAALGGTLHAFPFLDQVLVPTSAFGGFFASVTWPAGVPAGFELVFQFICLDGSSPFGLTLSNAVKGTTPPE